MSFRLIDRDWQSVLDAAAHAQPAELLIVCPFIQRGPVKRLLDLASPRTVRVLTRFDLRDFFDGVSDPAALRQLLDAGAQVRGVRNLHAKMYLFGQTRAIVTSANLTGAALTRNHEFGFESDELVTVGACRSYFDGLWVRAGTDLTPAVIAGWEDRIRTARTVVSWPGHPAGFGDEGADAGIPTAPPAAPALVAEAGQWFVKFFGRNASREPRSVRVIDEVRRSGAHWACSYPKGKRPRQVRDGAVMFVARMAKDPNDIIVFGRAIGQQHRPGRDDARATDLAIRPWKVKWPHYVRLHHPEFVAGTLANGVSLNELMAELGADSFESTQRHARTGSGNTNPRTAYLRKAQVRLSRKGAEWLIGRLEAVFTRFGTIPAAELGALDWPDLQSPPAEVSV